MSRAENSVLPPAKVCSCCQHPMLYHDPPRNEDDPFKEGFFPGCLGGAATGQGLTHWCGCSVRRQVTGVC